MFDTWYMNSCGKDAYTNNEEAWVVDERARAEIGGEGSDGEMGNKNNPRYGTMNSLTRIVFSEVQPECRSRVDDGHGSHGQTAP
jgi:hypothetical protein